MKKLIMAVVLLSSSFVFAETPGDDGGAAEQAVLVMSTALAEARQAQAQGSAPGLERVKIAGEVGDISFSSGMWFASHHPLQATNANFSDAEGNVRISMNDFTMNITFYDKASKQIGRYKLSSADMNRLAENLYDSTAECPTEVVIEKAAGKVKIKQVKDACEKVF